MTGMIVSVFGVAAPVVPVVFGAVGSAFAMLPVFLTNTFFLFAGAYVSRKRWRVSPAWLCVQTDRTRS